MLLIELWVENEKVMMCSASVRLAELVRRSGFPASTVHYYRRLGLLPAPVVGHRPARGYGEAHLERLSAISRLRSEQGLTLREIADRLAHTRPPRVFECKPGSASRRRWPVFAAARYRAARDG